MITPIFRAATPADAAGMADVMQTLTAAGQRTLPDDADYALTNYIAHNDALACTAAVDGDTVLGFQALKRATPGNPYDVTPGWGIIGTHISPTAHRRGIGRGLFAVTRAAAKAAGLPWIDATIGRQSSGARAYYAAMGFETYAGDDRCDRKRFAVT